ncbi:hypothetical protein C8F04DRAFT_1312907 [Mycena alexandri]|uniref:DUF7721 domain-containing protein n=1 Tax=Mycena alexandri TaxID=1745969 RepID=A0AAD6T6Q2_9AGAR|nr:hypothetical protein C8F04DRAFT_1312907 [Mycena alexandri]
MVHPAFPYCVQRSLSRRKASSDSRSSLWRLVCVYRAPHYHDETVSHAAAQHPDDEEYYKQASHHAQQNTEDHRPVSDDEIEEGKQAHAQIYQQGNKDNLQEMGSSAVGGAVITQVMKQFSGGGGGNPQDFMAIAMTEASSLLGGGADPGFKGEVMKKVAMMALKSQMGGGGGGGGMMTILQKFM